MAVRKRSIKERSIKDGGDEYQSILHREERIIEKTTVKKSEFSNPVEIYEKKIYEVKAKNRLDVERALKVLLQSQDIIVDVRPKRGTIYEADVLIFKMRDE